MLGLIEAKVSGVQARGVPPVSAPPQGASEVVPSGETSPEGISLSRRGCLLSGVLENSGESVIGFGILPITFL
jgi:hypothetical protein